MTPPRGAYHDHEWGRDERSPAALAVWLPLGLGAALALAAFYPGWLSFDSAYQWWQARHGHFNNLSPVTMTGLLALLHNLVGEHARALLFVLHQLAFWLGLGLCWRGLPLRSGYSFVALLLLPLLAPAWIVLAHLWVDASLIAAFTLGLGLMLWGRRHDLRWPFHLALPLLIYASATRLNAFPTALPLFALWIALYPRRQPLNRMLQLGLTGLIAACALGFSLGLDRALTLERVRTLPVQIINDLAGISALTGHLQLPPYTTYDGLTLERISDLYHAHGPVMLFQHNLPLRLGIGQDTYSTSEMRALFGHWLHTLATHPRAYLRHRARLLRPMLSGHYQPVDLLITPHDTAFRDNPPAPPRRPLGQAAYRLVAEHNAQRWPLFPLALSTAPALLIGLAAALTLGLRRQPTDYPTHAPAAALLTSAALHIAPLLLFAPSPEYRYIAWPALACVLAGLWTWGVRR